MFQRELLAIVRPRSSDTDGLVYAGGIDDDGMILGGKVRSPASGETYVVKDGYLDLLQGRGGADNVANLTNFLPGAGPTYEPLWRVHSLSLLTGERFPNDREMRIISTSWVWSGAAATSTSAAQLASTRAAWPACSITGVR
jgi:hypothetical protein